MAQEDEKPLGTSSPIPSFKQQPQQLSLNEYSETEAEETETETEPTKTDPFLQTQIKQRENLLQSQPYFAKTAPNRLSAATIRDHPRHEADHYDYHPRFLYLLSSFLSNLFSLSILISLTIKFI